MKAIPGPPPRSKPWYALRKFDPDRRGREIVFGASDAAACCGMSPYKTPLDVYCQALGLAPDEPDNDAMRMGRRLEPIILDEFEERTGQPLIRDCPMYFHADYAWMAATPDALADVQREADLYGVDAKASTFRRIDKEGLDPLKFGAEGTDQMPVDYVMQGQQQCAVLDLPYVAFPVLFDARTLRIYRVERNEDLIRSIRLAEKEMLERLKNSDPPEPNWSHENTRELIGLLFGRQKGLVHQLDEDDLAQWLELARLKDEIKSHEEVIRAGTNKLLFKIGAAERGLFPQGEKELRRIAVKESTYTVTRKAHVQLRECKAKE